MRAALAQAEKDYQSATNAAGVALRGKDYSEAVRQAELALGLKPQDATATALKAQAQQGQAALAQAEKDYQSATNAAGAALRQKDYPEVVKQADLALGLKPGDATATALKAQAQQGQAALAQAERDYQSATNAAGAALRQKDYPEAVKQADLALGLKPGDATASSLKAQAQQGQAALAQAEKDYQSATNAAGVALRQKDYPEAVKQADLALGLKPGDRTASALKAQAQQGQAALAQAEKDYQSATNAAGAAWGQKNYPETVRQADLALAIKPGDRTATALKQQAVAEQDLKTAEAHVEQGRYAEALQLCGAHKGDNRFQKLNDQATTESQQLQTATDAFNQGDYRFVSAMESSATAQKPPFAGLLKQARTESDALNSLLPLTNNVANRVQVDQQLSALEVTTRGKPPFRAIAVWLERTDPTKALLSDLQRLEDEIDALPKGAVLDSYYQRLDNLEIRCNEFYKKKVPDDVKRRLKGMKTKLNNLAFA